MLTYLKGLEVRIASLPTQCDKLGTALKNIRVAHATGALEHVKAVSTALDEYVQNLTDSFCPDEPLTVVQGLQSVYGAYKTQRTAEISVAAAGIAQESATAAAEEKVSADDIWAAPLLYQGMPGGDAWTDGSWKLKPDHLTSYEPEAYP